MGGPIPNRGLARSSHILLLRWMAPFETKIKTDIPKFQHVDFWGFGLILHDFGQMLTDFGQMFRTIWGQTCSERSERSARSERSEHEHCSGPTQAILPLLCQHGGFKNLVK